MDPDRYATTLNPPPDNMIQPATVGPTINPILDAALIFPKIPSLFKGGTMSARKALFIAELNLKIPTKKSEKRLPASYLLSYQAK